VKPVFVDANILLRFFRGDVQSKAAHGRKQSLEPGDKNV